MKKDSHITRKIIRNFWNFNSKYKLLFFGSTIAVVLAVISDSIISPLIIARVFSKLQTGLTNPHLKLHLGSFSGIIVEYLVIMIASFLFWRVNSYLAWILENKVQRDISKKIFKHLNKLSYKFHTDRFSGALVSQTNKYLGSYERMVDDFIWNILPGITTLLFSLVIVAFINLLIALVMLILCLIYLVSMYFRITKQLKTNALVSSAESMETAFISDNLTNIETVRAFGNEEYENEQFSKVANNTFEAIRKLSIDNAKSEILSHSQTNTFKFLALFGGLIAVVVTHTNISVMYILISYSQSIVNQIYQFNRTIRNINKSIGDAVEMTKILDLKPEIVDPINPLPATIVRGEIEFKNVNFAYPGSKDQYLFKDLNLKIKAGEKIGLVGPSGGGKTTLTKLLLRFMDINEGVIEIDGIDITKMNQQELRQHISYVPQEPMLFHRQLIDNIIYGNLESSYKEVLGAAKMSYADKFIKNLDAGYESLVGERGVKLSGGQRQRIAIARAILRNAPILVLDEATSALDSVSEKYIQSAIWELINKRTAIIIAHRLSTIQKMDRIIVIEKGQIKEQGTHKELLRENGLYAKLWSHQTGGFMED